MVVNLWLQHQSNVPMAFVWMDIRIPIGYSIGSDDKCYKRMLDPILNSYKNGCCYGCLLLFLVVVIVASVVVVIGHIDVPLSHKTFKLEQCGVAIKSQYLVQQLMNCQGL